MTVFLNSTTVEIKNIHKSYGSLEVLKGIDAVIEQGEIVSIVGASGAGKTTLLQIVGTLDKPDCGEILYDGRRVDNLPDREMARFRNGNIGFVFQFHQLLPEFTALENVMIPALIGGENQSDAEQEAKRILDFLSLSDRLGHKPAQLSGGEKQRISIARALIQKPNILILDEATAAMDTATERKIQSAIDNLKSGRTIIAIAHRLSTLRDADKLYVIEHGEVKESGTHDELIRTNGKYFELYKLPLPCQRT